MSGQLNVADSTDAAVAKEIGSYCPLEAPILLDLPDDKLDQK